MTNQEEIKECTTAEAVGEDEQIRIIEAILYAAGYPVSYAKIASVIGVTPSDVKKLVSEMQEVYNNPGTFSRGIELLTFSDSCQLCTKAELGGYVRDALGIRRGGNLSASSLEVLAIVAYNEPVTRSFIDTVRGVDSAYAVSNLIDKHLIAVCGRLDVPGRPMLYRTTEDFLRVFGISSLNELPEVEGKPAVPCDGNIPIEGMVFTETTDSMLASDDEANEQEDNV